MKNKQDNKAKKREKENLSVRMKQKKTKQLGKSKNHKFHAKQKFSANEGTTAERIERKVKQLQKVADKKGTDNMTRPTESATLSLGAGHIEKGSKKRKRSKEPQHETTSTETPFTDDGSPLAPKKFKEDDGSKLTRKQWRNRKKMEKNSSKKNKFKNLTLSKSNNQRDRTRDSPCSNSDPRDLERKHSAVFPVSESLPQASLSSEKDTQSKKKKKSSHLNSSRVSADADRSSPVVEKLGQSQKSVGLTPVPKKKQKTKVKYQKEVKKSASPNIHSNTDTSDFSYSDSEQSEPETLDYEGSNTNSHQTSSPGLSNESTRPAHTFSQKEVSSKKTKVVSALDKAHEKLNAARFRYLNEQLYTSMGKEALKMFQEDPEAFDIYHQGFRHQVSQWPVNPLDVIIKQLAKMPNSTTVADFGCGDAQLAESLPENVVHSFDLVSTKPCVTACDIAKVPLDNSSVNVAVFCLSLMGTNLSHYLCEANRVLHQGGLLKIAEVVSRFYSVSRFVSDVEALGFHLQKKTFLDKMFMMFTFKKVTGCSRKKAPRIQLKACFYKRR